MNTDLIEQTVQASAAGTLPFPVVIDRLVAGGVEFYQRKNAPNTWGLDSYRATRSPRAGSSIQTADSEHHPPPFSL